MLKQGCVRMILLKENDMEYGGSEVNSSNRNRK